MVEKLFDEIGRKKKLLGNGDYDDLDDSLR
jgi:hypothetical protein